MMNISMKNACSLLRDDFDTIRVIFNKDLRNKPISKPSHKTPPDSYEILTGDSWDEVVNGLDKYKVYTYKALKSDEVRVGDKVVVCVEGDGTPADEKVFKVVTVVEVVEGDDIDYNEDKYIKWIVGKNDYDRYERLKVEDRNANKNISNEQRKVAKSQLREAIKMALLTQTVQVPGDANNS